MKELLWSKDESQMNGGKAMMMMSMKPVNGVPRKTFSASLEQHQRQRRIRLPPSDSEEEYNDENSFFGGSFSEEENYLRRLENFGGTNCGENGGPRTVLNSDSKCFAKSEDILSHNVRGDNKEQFIFHPDFPRTSCHPREPSPQTEVNHYYYRHPSSIDGENRFTSQIPPTVVVNHGNKTYCEDIPNGSGVPNVVIPTGDYNVPSWATNENCPCSKKTNRRKRRREYDSSSFHNFKKEGTLLTRNLNGNEKHREKEIGWLRSSGGFLGKSSLSCASSLLPSFSLSLPFPRVDRELNGSSWRSCSSTLVSSLSVPQVGKRKRAGGLQQNRRNHKPVTFLLNLLLLFHLAREQEPFVGRVEAGNIPLGVVFEQGSAEIQSAFAYALSTFTPLNISSDPRDKFPFNAYVDTINTADAFKLSKLICNQFFRGVYAIVGSMNSESFQTFHSYANTFQMPIVTPGFPTRARKVSKFQVQQSLNLNSAMDFVSRGENATLSPLVRSPLINDTFQRLLDSVASPTSAEVGTSSASSSSGETEASRDKLMEKLVEEIMARESDRLDFVTKIRPDLHQAILDITAHYGWRNVIYLFHSNEGLLRLQSIFEKQGFKNDSIRVRVMKRISSVMDALSIIRNIEVAQRFQSKHIILDCPASLAKDIIISHVRDLHLGRRTYHYLIAGLAFDEPWERSVVEFTAVNITGFRMVDPDRKLVKDFLSKWATLDTNQFEGGGKRYISATAALMHDGVLVIKEAFTNILRENPDALRREKGRNLTCHSGVDFLNPIVPFEHGKLINERLRRVQAEGLTGHIEFNEQGSRKNFSVDVMEITLENGQTKVGEWSDVSGFITAQQLSDPLSKRRRPDRKREFVVTSILEEPYLMLKKAEKGETLVGNDQYEGFCKDLSDQIAEDMNFKYKIVLVKDGRYGSENVTAPGGWDGMIGELIRHEADMSIASLTITAQRETVVDFSMDFMEAGISIMIKKPQTEMPGAFSFVKPMRGSVWFASFAAVVVVALVLLLVQGKSPRQKLSGSGHDSPDTNCKTKTAPPSSRKRSSAGAPETAPSGEAENSHTFPNTLWFSIASVFRQSTPFTPRTWTGFCLHLHLSPSLITALSSEIWFKGVLYSFFVEEADIGISSLTITAERERVVDFTKPFINLGISIMLYKPKKSNSGVFGFFHPLSTNTWYCVIVAYIGVSFVLYIVTLVNPTEWITETEGLLRNQFSFPNALWFSFAALVQQGSDLTPRSFAGRLVGSVWWFFTLILISSYTANFAAVRTVNRMVLPIKSAKDLSEQSDIQYGTLLGGSTYEFFRRSEVTVYKGMFEYMSGPYSANVKSYDDGIKLVRERKGKYALLIESPKNDYTNQRKPCDTMKVGPNLDSKGFGIGTPLGSPLKHQINLEVLTLKENGFLSKLESKWWFERSECDVTNKQETATGDEELSLGSLAGIFYILIIGLVLSMVVSFLEFCYNSKKEAQKSKLSLTEAMKKKAKNTITGPLPSNGDPVTCIH